MVPYSIDRGSQESSVGRPCKSITKARVAELDFPYVIEMEVPAKGLNVRLSREIGMFHCSHEIRPRFGRSRVKNDQHYCRWCFSDPLVADAFLERFGGARVI